MKTNLELKIAILKKFQTQYDFAIAVGTHETTVSKVLKGRKRLTEAEGLLWQKALDCESSLLQSVTEMN